MAGPKMTFVVVAVTGNLATLQQVVDPDAEPIPARHGEVDPGAGRQINVPVGTDDLDFFQNLRGRQVSISFEEVQGRRGQRGGAAGLRATEVPPGAQRDPNDPRGTATAGGRFAPAQPGAMAPGASTPGAAAPQGAPAGVPAAGSPPAGTTPSTT